MVTSEADQIPAVEQDDGVITARRHGTRTRPTADGHSARRGAVLLIAQAKPPVLPASKAEDPAAVRQQEAVAAAAGCLPRRQVQLDALRLGVQELITARALGATAVRAAHTDTKLPEAIVTARPHRAQCAH